MTPRRHHHRTIARARRPRVASPRTASAMVEDYIAQAPEPARRMLTTLRATIRSVLPGDVTETMSYRVPAFTRAGVVVWYGAFADHCSLFPGGSVLGRLKDAARYKISKGTIQFPLSKPLPIRLVKQIVNARVAEQQAKGHQKLKRQVS